MTHRTWTVVLLLLLGCPAVAQEASEQDASSNQAADVEQAEQAAEEASDPTAEPQPGQAAPDQQAPPAASEPTEALAALRQEIDQLLTPTGMPSETEADEDDAGARKQAIEDVARRSRQLAEGNADQPQVQYEANQIELRAYNALAQDATAKQQPVEASYRLTQLRNAAARARGNDYAPADATGDFWMLVADLIDINRSGATLADRQEQAAAKMTAFMDQHGQSPDAPPGIVTDIKASLVRLHDQAGRNDQACTMLDELTEALGAEHPAVASLADVAAACAVVGRQPELQVTADGSAWSLAGHRGKPVVVTVTLWGSDAGGRLITSLTQRRDGWGDGAVAILSLTLGGGQQAQALPWPVAPVEAGDPALTALGVQEVPRVLVFDAEGRLAASGTTEAVLGRVGALLAPPEPSESP